MRVLSGADVARVWVLLGEDDYRIAVRAHLVGLPSRESGGWRPESRGGFRRITGVADVTPVGVDDAGWDRLRKSLQENVDAFDECAAASRTTAAPDHEVRWPRSEPFRGRARWLGTIHAAWQSLS